MSTPPSPCIGNCCLNEKEVCLGCFRSLPEITEWSQASSLRKHTIIGNTKKRMEVSSLSKKSNR